MDKVIEVLKNIWKITELKDRIGLTLILLVVYRFGAQVVLPGIDATKLGQIAENTEQGILGLLNAFTGGAFANASVFALGIMPYISASIVVVFAIISVMFIVPKSNRNFNEFISENIKSEDKRNTSRLFKQINDNEFIYVSSYDPNRQRGLNFTLENFDKNTLKHKISASTIRWDDSIFRLTNYVKRSILDNEEIIEKVTRKDTILDFDIEDLAPLNYVAETLNFF